MTTPSAQAVHNLVEDNFVGTIEDCSLIDKGTDIIYQIVVNDEEGTSTYYFKTVDQNHMDAFQSEPLLQYYISTQTTLPTADVITMDLSGHNAIDRPYFLMTGLPGEHPNADWGSETLYDVVEQMGNALGQIHDTVVFDTAGEVLVSDYEPETIDVDADAPEPSLTFTPTGFDSWESMITQSARMLLEDAEEPFDGYADEIIQYYESHAHHIPADDEVTLTFLHGDYRFDNVLFERSQTGPALSGVLDWGRTVAGDRRYNLIRTAYLFDRAFPDEPARQTMRDRFYRGYNATNEITRNAQFDALKPLYQLHVMTVEFRWFSQWYANRRADWRQARREYLLDQLTGLLDQSPNNADP